MHDEHLPKLMWKLARIKEVTTGRDGKVRSALVKVAGGSELRRPVQLLYPLEC